MSPRNPTTTFLVGSPNFSYLKLNHMPIYYIFVTSDWQHFKKRGPLAKGAENRTTATTFLQTGNFVKPPTSAAIKSTLLRN